MGSFSHLERSLTFLEPIVHPVPNIYYISWQSIKVNLTSSTMFDPFSAAIYGNIVSQPLGHIADGQSGESSWPATFLTIVSNEAESSPRMFCESGKDARNR